MQYLNIETRILHSPEFIGSDPAERATWLALSMWCAQQENAGRIVGAKSWKDRQWQQTCGVTVREVARSTRLIAWDGDDALIWNYPDAKEKEVQAKRKAGRDTVAKRWPQANSSADSSASRSADTEGKGKERELEMEGNGRGNGMEEEGGVGEGGTTQPDLSGFVPPPDLVLTTFPTSGKQTAWDLRQSFVDELSRLFPNVTVANEAEKALMKINRGMVPKKTARGMERFLMTWMERAQNGARANNGEKPRTTKYADAF
jgi:hypothetical protein